MSSSDAAPVVDYRAYLSPRALHRRTPAIRAQAALQGEGMLALGSGFPNKGSFPFVALSIALADGTALTVDGGELQAALQYHAHTVGLDELVARLRVMQQRQHAPPRAVDVCVLPGSQDGIAKAFDMLLGEADAVLVESPCYAGALSVLDSIGCRVVEVATDADGAEPAALDALLSAWGGPQPKPRLLYLTPTGGNPTGVTMSGPRRAALYAVARAHGLLILEDDAYWHLTFGEPSARPPSFLSLDVDGRVLRLDSFSKTVSGGLRMGLATGPPPLVKALCTVTQSSLIHSSGVSQAVLLALLRHWGVGDAASTDATGLGRMAAHIARVQSIYAAQRDAMVAAVRRHLRRTLPAAAGTTATTAASAADGATDDDGDANLLVDFKVPGAGMFLWLRLRDVDDAHTLVTVDAVAAGVLMVPGYAFFASLSHGGGDAGPCPYIRLSYSLASPADMDEGLRRLGCLLRGEPTRHT